MANEQIGITLSPQERLVVEAIANELGKPVAAVLRDCALEGLDSQIQKVERMRKYLQSQKTDAPNI